jgi:addiction module HigA family antidote
MTSTSRPFQPDWVTHPGEHLAEYLESWGMSQAELADRTGLHRKTINAIINGTMSITADTAVLLEPIFGMPANFWVNLDAQYHAYMARKSQHAHIEAQHAQMSRFPIKDMQKRDLLPRTTDPIALGVALMQFFALGDFDQWAVVWQRSPLVVAYRQQRAETKTPELVSVWLREGQRLVEHREYIPFDAAKLREALPQMRQLTTQPNDQFWPVLEGICTDAGVYLVRVRPYTNLGVYAATYRFRGRTVLQMSGLRRSVDQFWFSFFHEVGHLLLHGVKELFLDQAPTDGTEHAAVPETADATEHADTQEAEANAFAARTLIPDGAMRQFIREAKSTYTSPAIERFAAQQGIHPGIVVGRLQHEQVLPYAATLNSLKDSYSWAYEIVRKNSV